LERAEDGKDGCGTEVCESICSEKIYQSVLTEFKHQREDFKEKKRPVCFFFRRKSLVGT